MTEHAGAASFQAHLFCFGINAVLASELNNENVMKTQTKTYTDFKSQISCSLQSFWILKTFKAEALKINTSTLGVPLLLDHSLKIPRKKNPTKCVETSESVSASLYHFKASVTLILIFLCFIVCCVHHNICLVLQIRNRECICVLILLAILSF